MAKRPPYYKEADVLITGLTLAKPYADASPFPITAHSDHAPLQWIKTSAKGPVTGWRIENLGGMDYIVKYRPGPLMGVPDALSRYPFLGPKRLTRLGADNALKTLLDILPNSSNVLCPNNKGPIYFWAARDTPTLIDRVRTWRGGVGRFVTKAPKSACSDQSWQLAIVMPRTDNATNACRLIYKTKRPACILMPADLLHMSSQNLDGSYDKEMAAAIDAAPKYSLLAAQLVWVVFGITDAPKHMVLNTECAAYMPPNISEEHAATVGTLVQWIVEQTNSLNLEQAKLLNNRLSTLDSGLTMYDPVDGPRIYVPIQRRRHLYEFAHNAKNHMGAAITYSELKKSYYWPTMRKDVHTWYSECGRCNLLKAKRNLTHASSRGISGEAPRKRWAMDFHGVGTEGRKANILGAIDLDSLHVELALFAHRTAKNVKTFVRDRILLTHGTPKSLHSDHAREFVGMAMTDLARTFKYLNTSTGGYCPTGNSTIESFWQYFNVCLRNLSDAEYENVEDHLQNIAWVWNTTVRSSTTARPFEVMTGTSPVTITDSLVLPPPTNNTLNMSNIRESSAAYAQIAREHGDFMRARRAMVLNKRGRVLKALKVNDYVKIYVPPSHAEAVRRRRKAKHICQWRGPLKITEKLSNTTFKLSSHLNPSKTFKRHLMNVRKWLGPLPDPQTASTDAMMPMTSDIEPGQFVFARDSDSSNMLYLARVASVDDLGVEVHAWGTSSKNHIESQYRPVMILESNSLPTTRPRRAACQPWSWQVPTDAIEDLILLRPVDVTASGKLDAATRRRVRALPDTYVFRKFLS